MVDSFTIDTARVHGGGISLITESEDARSLYEALARLYHFAASRLLVLS